MNTCKLSYEAYQQTFQAPMQDVTATAEQQLDIWPYVEAIPVSDLGELTLLDVTYVYRSADGSFEHVLIATSTENVFLVVIVNLDKPRIQGHHVLDLEELYGLLAVSE